MKVSYIVTVYNKASYLPFVINGLSRQEGEFDKEYIFVDDGSTDNSVEVLVKGTKTLPGPVEIIEQSNGGPAVASNNGFAASSGELIKFVDGDDVLLPWATRVLVGTMQTGGHVYAFGVDPVPVDFSTITLQSINDTVDRLRPGVEDRHPLAWRKPLEHVIRRSYSNPTSWIATRDAVVSTGGCATHIFIQDYILELTLAAQGTAGIWPGPIFLYPRADAERLSANKAQILHDLNMALAELFRRRPEQLPEHGFVAAKRATGRAWRFASRHQAPWSIKLRTFLWYLGVRARFVKPSPRLIEATAVAFHGGSLIR